MLDISALRSFYPVVMTPSHDGKYFQNYVLSLLDFVAECGHHGMPMRYMLKSGESLITRARNGCVAEFLAHPEWTHLFWIDSDIGFSAAAAFRLLLSNYDVAAGVYPMKMEGWPEHGVSERTTRELFEWNYTRYPVNAEISPGSDRVEIDVQSDGFIRVSEAPTGFMVIKRRVFERLIAAYPELQYIPDGVGRDGVGELDQGRHFRFFDVAVHPVTRRYLSEDYGFCRLWSELGESIYIDANSNLSHQGSKVYRGDFAASLMTNLGRAVGAPAGAPMVLTGQQHLCSNEPGPIGSAHQMKRR